MAQRYTYERMTPEQFKAAQAEIGIGGHTLARLLGFPMNRLDRWEAGEDAIPHVVCIALSLLTLPGAKGVAWAVTDAKIGEKVDA